MDKLPKGWKIVTIGDIAIKVVDGSHNPPKDKGEGIPMISAQNVINGEINLNASRYISEEEFRNEQKRTNIEVGDIFLTIVGTIGRCAVVRNIDVKFAIQRSIAIIRTREDSFYLYYYFQSPQFVELLSSNARGAAQQGIYLGQLKSLQIPLPPFSEQTRMVSKLDSLFARIDKSIALLEENIKHTKRLMASVLEETFGEFDMTIYKPMLDVCSIYNNTMTPKDGEIYNYVGLENIESISGKLVEFSPSKGETIKSSKVRFEVDAVLYGKLRPYLNKVWVASFDGIATTEILPFKPNKKELNPTFLSYFLRSSSFVTLVNGNTSGARMPRATTSFFKSIAKVPVPDIETQSNISKKLDFVSQKTNQIIFEQQSKLAYLKALKSSLLDRAFKAEL